MVTVKDGELYCVSCGSDNCNHISLIRDIYNNTELTQLSRYRRRARPNKEMEGIRVSSQVTKDIYTVYEMSDGSYACNCPAFLSGKVRSIDNGRKGVACKHIEDLQSRADNTMFRNSTLYQGLLFTALSGAEGNLTKFKDYTDAQAYIVIEELLKKQGLTYWEVESVLSSGRSMSTLPLVSFGVEYEGGNLPQRTIAELLFNSGYYGCLVNNYHSIRRASSVDFSRYPAGISNASFGIVVVPDQKTEESCYVNGGTDASIHLSNPIELKSSRLIGAGGANSMRSFTNFLEKLYREGFTANSSCGMHLSISVHGLKPRELAHFYGLWTCLQGVSKYLVSPRRRRNDYCKIISTSPSNLASVYEKINQRNFTGFDRKESLNVTNVKTQSNGLLSGRIEIRLHDASKNKIFDKFMAWTTYCLKMLEASRTNPELKEMAAKAFIDENIRQELSNMPIEDVLTMIGIDTSTSFMRQQREHLLYRYEGYRRKAENRDMVGIDDWVKERMIFLDSGSVSVLDEIANDVSNQEQNQDRQEHQEQNASPDTTTVGAENTGVSQVEARKELFNTLFDLSRSFISRSSETGRTFSIGFDCRRDEDTVNLYIGWGVENQEETQEYQAEMQRVKEVLSANGISSLSWGWDYDIDENGVFTLKADISPIVSKILTEEGFHVVVLGATPDNDEAFLVLHPNLVSRHRIDYTSTPKDFYSNSFLQLFKKDDLSPETVCYGGCSCKTFHNRGNCRHMEYIMDSRSVISGMVSTIRIGRRRQGRRANGQV